LSGVGLRTALSGGGGGEAYFDFLDSLPIPAWVADERGLCTFHNKAGLAFRGKSREDVLAEGWAGFIHSDDIAKLADQLASLTHSSSPRQIEFRIGAAPATIAGSFARWLPDTTARAAFPVALDTRLTYRASRERQKHFSTAKHVTGNSSIRT